jgi:hypothetical protein
LSRCSRIKADGERCKGTAIDTSGLCYAHSPNRAQERRRAASKGGKRGGRGRGNGDIKDVKAWLLKLASDVEEGRLKAKDCAVVSQILNVFLRGVEVQRRIKESEELEERLEALESVLKGRKAG